MQELARELVHRFLDWPYGEPIANIAKILAIMIGFLTSVPIMVYCERKICAFIQDRIGPNRVGPFGLLQPLADAVKLFFKEDIIPEKADKVLFILAPCLTLIAPLLVIAVMPIGPDVIIAGKHFVLQIANIDLGILFIMMVASFSVYGLVFAGWASNNKYSLLGGLRATSQMISYEVAMGLSLLAVLMSSYGTTSMNGIIEMQQGFILGTDFIPAWNVFRQPIAFLIFFVTAFAETNRLPFDLPECESELISGYHTEYSSMKFAMFFMGEYVALAVMAGLITTLFFGGWSLPFEVFPLHSIQAAILGVMVFVAKTGFFVFFFIWVRWTLPRFRFDQLMNLGWKVLIPLGFLNIIITALI